MSDENEKAKPQIIIGPKTCDVHHMAVKKNPDGTVEAGVVRQIAVKDGDPIPDDAMAIPHGLNYKGWQDAETVGEMKKNGPSKVNTKSYQSGWDRIFGGKEGGDSVN
jgi:hypothetical protein